MTSFNREIYSIKIKISSYISLIKGVHDIFSGKLLAVRQPSIKKERIPSVVIPPEMKLFSGFYVLNNYFPYYPKRIRACFSLDLPAVHFKEIHEDYFKSLNQFLFHDFSDQLQYRYKLLLLCGMMFWVDQQDKREIYILNQAIDNLLKLESIVNLSIFNHPILPDILPEYNTPSIFPSPFHCLVRVEKCMPPPLPDFFHKIHQNINRNYTSLKCDVVVRFFLDEMINSLITLLKFIDTVSDQTIKIDFLKKINLIYSKYQGIFDWLIKEKDIIFNPQKISNERINEDNFFVMENVERFESDELKFIYNNLEKIFLPSLECSKDKIKKILILLINQVKT